MRERWKRPSIWPVVVPLGLLLTVSGVLSRGEVPYLLHARRATATVDEWVRVKTGRRDRTGNEVTALALDYHVSQARDAAWRGRDVFTNYWEAPAVGEKLNVEYLPGRTGSLRVVGNGPKLMPALFVFCVLAFAAVGIVLALEQREARRRRHQALGARVPAEDEDEE